MAVEWDLTVEVAVIFRPMLANSDLDSNIYANKLCKLTTLSVRYRSLYSIWYHLYIDMLCKTIKILGFNKHKSTTKPFTRFYSETIRR